MRIRNVQPGDLLALKDIMNYYRTQTTYSWNRNPVSMSDMEEWLVNHQRHPYLAVVAEIDEVIIGYASLSQFRSSGYYPTAEGSIYLVPDYTGMGYGTVLMKELLLRAKASGLRVVTAWIDSRNEASIEFHEKFGFYYVGTMKNVGIIDGQPASVVIEQYDII